MRQAGDESPLELARRRLNAAIDTLEAAVNRRRDEDRHRDALEAQLQAFGADRSKLADELDRVRAMANGIEAVRGFRVVIREGRVVPEVISAVRDEDAGVVVMGRSSDAPGAMAYEVLRRTDALVLMVP